MLTRITSTLTPASYYEQIRNICSTQSSVHTSCLGILYIHNITQSYNWILGILCTGTILHNMYHIKFVDQDVKIFSGNFLCRLLQILQRSPIILNDSISVKRNTLVDHADTPQAGHEQERVKPTFQSYPVLCILISRPEYPDIQS